MSQASRWRRSADIREKAQAMLRSVLISPNEGALTACCSLPLDPGGDLSPRVEIQLVEQVLNVVIHRALREEQFAGDFSVAHAGGDQLGDLELASSDGQCSMWAKAVSGRRSRPGQPGSHLDRQHGERGGDRQRQPYPQYPVPRARQRRQSDAEGISQLAQNGRHQKLEITAVNTPLWLLAL